MPRIPSLLAAITPQELHDFLPEPLLSELRTLFPGFRQLDSGHLGPGDWERELAQANPEVLITCWSTPALPATLPPNLRYVCHLTGGVKGLLTRGHLGQGLLVTNWGGSISRTVAECALLHILSGLRRASHWAIAMHCEGAWRIGDVETSSLFGRRVGLHGFGHVARALTQLLHPFSTAISVLAPDVDAAMEAAYGVTRAPSLDALFADNEVIVELAPLIPGTRGLITERHLRLIRPGGIFVNVGRGAVVDEDALLRVAREGRVFFGLDVFATEPLPPDSALRGLRNVSLTPHIAGPTTDRKGDAGAFSLRNLRAYVEGRPLEGVVTPAIYDQST